MNWNRVTKSRPCSVCGKSSWCVVNHELKLIMCMRVESKRVKVTRSGETGYIHPLDPNTPAVTLTKREKPKPVINCSKLLSRWEAETKEGQWIALSKSLGVTVSSLKAMGACWSREHAAWAFPMRDGYENLVGIRLRAWDGSKFAVTGSHQGCFVPRMDNWDLLALVAEGPTDTAAGLDLGFHSVGRPSCSGGASDLATLFKRRKVTRAAIVADNDGPGLRGAQMLAPHLRVPCAILVLPTKDLREFLRCGGTYTVLRNLIELSVWTNERTGASAV